MNLILLFKKDFIDSQRVRITGRRLEHVKKVHKASKGDTLEVGLINSNMGTGEVTKITSSSLEMDVILTKQPPAPIPLTLILALPRPKMFKRILQTITTLGVKKIYLINSWRVEKSFWKSPAMEKENLEKELILGLEQAKDTMMPEIFIKRLFKPFVTKELPKIAKNSLALTAHPKTELLCPRNVKQDTMLAMGPEGGFIDIEIKTFERAGFKTVSLGKRILRTETAVPVLISRLF
ncbi:MAG: 16S rRNA (uracil(1498)-N(3))-methyltransferase [Thermodesulfobacteriota bacterium]|nr:16S rRNA (uracil(1498)-N(3))-methyltransferase [Thermodesulfobacteriota bacterium]